MILASERPAETDGENMARSSNDRGQSGRPTDGPITKYLNRRFSSAVTRFIISKNIPVTANQMTLISFFIALASPPMYVFGVPAAGGIMAQFSSMVDCVDGEIARARGTTSPFGGFLDTMLDRFADLAILVAASYYVFATRDLSLMTLLACLLAISGDILVSYLHAASRTFLSRHPALMGRIPSFASRDTRIFVLFIFSLPGEVFLGLLMLAVLTHAYVISKSLEVVLIIRRSPDQVR